MLRESGEESGREGARILRVYIKEPSAFLIQNAKHNRRLGRWPHQHVRVIHHWERGEQGFGWRGEVEEVGREGWGSTETTSLSATLSNLPSSSHTPQYKATPLP